MFYFVPKTELFAGGPGVFHSANASGEVGREWLLHSNPQFCKELRKSCIYLDGVNLQAIGF
jgi:hypothetical protein